MKIRKIIASVLLAASVPTGCTTPIDADEQSDTQIAATLQEAFAIIDASLLSPPWWKEELKAGASQSTSMLQPRLEFSDVRGHVAAQEIHELANFAWPLMETGTALGGFADGTFKPDADITRAQLAVMVVKNGYRAKMISDVVVTPAGAVPSRSPFSDLPTTHWAYEPIARAQQFGILSGYPDGTFRPDAKVTRAEAVAAVVKSLGLNRPSWTPIARLYNDANSIPSWAQGAYSRAAQAGVFSNQGLHQLAAPLQPTAQATRAVVASYIYWATVAAINEPPPPTIMGSATASLEHVRDILKQTNPQGLIQFGEFINGVREKDIIDLYYEEAALEGVAADVAVAQMLVETNNLRFVGTELDPSLNNFAGLGDIGRPWAQFANTKLGVRAHIQTLKAYASVRPLNQELVAQRFRFITRGVAPRPENLGGRWRADSNYGNMIRVKVDELRRPVFGPGELNDAPWTLGNLLDGTQLLLDIVGFIPGVGEIADATNAGISSLRGDFVGAALSAISLVPIAGDAIGKGSKALIKAAETPAGRVAGKEAARKLFELVGKTDLVMFYENLRGAMRQIPNIGTQADSALIGISRGLDEVIGKISDAFGLPKPAFATVDAGGVIRSNRPNPPSSTGGALADAINATIAKTIAVVTSLPVPVQLSRVALTAELKFTELARKGFLNGGHLRAHVLPVGKEARDKFFSDAIRTRKFSTFGIFASEKIAREATAAALQRLKTEAGIDLISPGVIPDALKNLAAGAELRFNGIVLTKSDGKIAATVQFSETIGTAARIGKESVTSRASADAVTIVINPSREGLTTVYPSVF